MVLDQNLFLEVGSWITITFTSYYPCSKNRPRRGLLGRLNVMRVDSVANCVNSVALCGGLWNGRGWRGIRKRGRVTVNKLPPIRMVPCFDIINNFFIFPNRTEIGFSGCFAELDWRKVEPWLKIHGGYVGVARTNQKARQDQSTLTVWWNS